MTEGTFHRVRVTGVKEIGSAIALSWERDFDFSPGQLVAISRREAGPSRLYSLFSGPQDDEAGVLFILVEEGELTPDLARAARGDELWIQGPSGSFPPVSGPGVWIANGTGVAPFLSMARAGLSPGKRLVHGARTLEDFYFHEELEAVMGDRYVRCCSRLGLGVEAAAGSPKPTNVYPGRLTVYLESESWDPRRLYELCGSASMVVDVRDLLIGKGVPHSRIVSEVYF